MTKTYETTITIDTAYGVLEDVPCVVSYEAEFIGKDPSIGEYYDKWTANARLDNVNVDALYMSRGLVSGMVGEFELARQEALIAEKIASELDTGDLEYV